MRITAQNWWNWKYLIINPIIIALMYMYYSQWKARNNNTNKDSNNNSDNHVDNKNMKINSDNHDANKNM